jgi:hypothetical protein
MPQNATRLINWRLSQNSVYVPTELQSYVKRPLHSNCPQQSVFLQRYVKSPLHPWLLTPFSNKKDQIKTPLCKQQWATNFLGYLSVSKGSSSFLSNKSYLCADLAIPRTNSLPHEPILRLVKAWIFKPAHKISGTSDGTALLDQRSVWLSAKPAAVFSLCTVFLRDFLIMVSHQHHLANLGLTWFQIWWCCLLPTCDPRPSPGLIQVCLMLHWRRPVWFQHLVIFSHLSILPSAGGSKSGNFCVADSVSVPPSGSDLTAQSLIPQAHLCL